MYKKYGDAMPTYGGLVQRLAVEDETPFITFTNTLLDGVGPAGDIGSDDECGRRSRFRTRCHPAVLGVW